jgi:hypothetical protein
MDELTPFAVHNATGVRVPASLILALRGARHVAVLTGAGVSAESGIPTFRDALTGASGNGSMPSSLPRPLPSGVTRIWYGAGTNGGA